MRILGTVLQVVCGAWLFIDFYIRSSYYAEQMEVTNWKDSSPDFMALLSMLTAGSTWNAIIILLVVYLLKKKV